jgi:hypothetical protein
MKNEVQKLIESIVFETLLEFKSSFKWSEFKSQGDIYDALEYCRTQNLPYLGQGSSRIVFALPNTKYVLKLARNSRGIAQNEAEVDLFTDPKTKLIVAQIYDFDSEFKWLISETVKPFRHGSSDNEFEDLTNMKFDDFYNIEYIKDDKNNEIKVYNSYPHLKTNIFFQTAKHLYLNSTLMAGDFFILSHWGKTADGRVVILDYGFTKDVMHKHY